MSFEEQQRWNIKLLKFLIGLVVFIVCLAMILGLVGIILYKSGEVSLKASVEQEAPVITIDEEEIAQTKTNFGLNTIPWQDGWIAYQDGVYEYNEDTLNFLILGIDKGGELSKVTDLSDWNAGQADTIFLVSLNSLDKSIRIIGIPRNSMIQLDVYNSEQKKIDSIYNQICLQYGYAGGGELGLSEMKNSVSDLFHELPIHGACALSYDAIGVLVDKIGGIDIIMPDDLTSENKEWIKGAEVQLNKSNVVSYLRYRGTAFMSSTERLTRQKEFMKYAMVKGISVIKDNPTIVGELYQSILPYMNTDITMNQAVYIATQSIGYTFDTDSFQQLSGTDVMVEKGYVDAQGYDNYDDLYLDEDALLDVMIKNFYHRVSMQ